MKDRDSLKKHMEDNHLIITFYNCTTCEFKSTILKEFKIHVDTFHSRVQVDMSRIPGDKMSEEVSKTLGCSQCNYRCKYNIQLKKHNLAKHQLHECAECTFTTQSLEHITDHRNSKHAARNFNCDVCDYLALTPFEMFVHKVAMHQAYQQTKPDSVYEMQELFLTGLAGRVDFILESVIKSKVEVLEQLDEIKNKNNFLEAELKKTRGEVNDVKAALFKSNSFNNNMQSDSEAMLRNIADRCQKLENTAERLTMDKTDPKNVDAGQGIGVKPSENEKSAKPPAPENVNKKQSKGLKKKHKIAWVGTSISKVLDKGKFESDINVELKTERAYCIKDDPNAFFRESNFRKVVPKVLKNNDIDTLVLQTGSIEISNIDVNQSVMDPKKEIDQYKKEWFAKVEEDSSNLFDIAEDAIKHSSNLKKVVIIKRLPRFDRSRDDILGIKSQLSKYGNNCYDQQYIKRGRPENICIVELNGLEPAGYLRDIVYGNVNKESYDGIHFRGQHASRHFTLRAVQAIKTIINCQPNPSLPRQKNEKKSDNHRNFPQAKYQTQQTNQRPANYANSQSEKAISGHQSAPSSQGVRYSDIVIGNKYNVSTANRYAPLN